MGNVDLLARVGLFVVKDFFDAEVCARLRAEAQSARASQASVVRDTTLIDETSRRTKELAVSTSTTSFTKERLLGIKTGLENHFQLKLVGCESPQFLAYGPGDFFSLHQDSSQETYKPQYVKERKVSVVVFLNRQTEKPESVSYCGGSLTLYGLIQNPGWEKYGFPLGGQAGLLVAFRSDILHEVEEVSGGERYTIVSWYF